MTAQTSQSSLPFTDIQNLIKNIAPPENDRQEKHDKKAANVAQNPTSLGFLDYLSRYVAMWQDRYPPAILKPEIALFVSSQSVENTCPENPTTETFEHIISQLHKGEQTINQICNMNGYGLKIYDLNRTLPTENITSEAAMSELEAAQIIAVSMEAVKETDLLLIGDIGLNQNISAHAITYALFNDETLDKDNFHPLAAKALDFHGENHSPLELLRRVGCREIAAMIGAIVAARYQNVPIILDGINALVAAMIVYKINPEAIQHCIIGQISDEPIPVMIARRIGLVPVTMLDITAGMGIGGAMAINIIKSSINIHNYTNI